MDEKLPVYIGPDALPRLLEYIRSNGLSRFVLVSDQNTFEALGRRVAQALQVSHADVITITLAGAEVVADEHHVVRVLAQIDNQDRTYLAVGAGTLTDITRFVSHRTKSAFICLPTAPSVDGFTSIGAPLVIGGLKQTFACQPPMALFADVNVLRHAPKAMIQAGFGDMLGKLLSTADWKLAHVIWDERYDESIAHQCVEAAGSCVDLRREIGAMTEHGIHTLMSGLVQVGLGMLAVGNSSPASGAEHHVSHFWELKLLREGRPAVLHGAKVGVASVLMAERYRRLVELGPASVAERMKWSHMPSRDHQIAAIHAVYGPIAEKIIEGQSAFLNLSEERFHALRRRIIGRWDEIQAIARALPSPEHLTVWLKEVGAPTSARALGLTDQEVVFALQYGHYLRNRFTISKLWLMLGLDGRSA